jgi:hypothetical protein
MGTTLDVQTLKKCVVILAVLSFTFSVVGGLSLARALALANAFMALWIAYTLLQLQTDHTALMVVSWNHFDTSIAVFAVVLAFAYAGLSYSGWASILIAAVAFLLFQGFATIFLDPARGAPLNALNNFTVQRGGKRYYAVSVRAERMSTALLIVILLLCGTIIKNNKSE